MEISAAGPLRLSPEPDAPHADEDDRHERDYQSDEERVQDHFAAIVPAVGLGSNSSHMGSESGAISRFIPLRLTF